MLLLLKFTKKIIVRLTCINVAIKLIAFNLIIWFGLIFWFDRIENLNQKPDFLIRLNNALTISD